MKNYNEVADSLFVRREQYQMKRKRNIKALSVVACCIVFLGTFITLNFKPTVKDHEIEYKYITNYPSNNLDWYYVPKPAEYVVVPNVGEIRSVHENDNLVRYLLKLEIYNEKGIIQDDELLNEYQRLLESGLVFHEVEVWTYVDPTTKNYYNEIIVEMSNELFDNFNINEKYGYLFSFICNGDGSDIKIEDCNLIETFLK